MAVGVDLVGQSNLWALSWSANGTLLSIYNNGNGVCNSVCLSVSQYILSRLSCLSGRATYLHPPFCEINDLLGADLYQSSVCYLLWHIGVDVLVIVVEYKAIYVDLGNSSGNASLQQLLREAIGSVKSDSYPATNLFSHSVKPNFFISHMVSILLLSFHRQTCLSIPCKV
jgi:hypothetical protein